MNDARAVGAYWNRLYESYDNGIKYLAMMMRTNKLVVELCSSETQQGAEFFCLFQYAYELLGTPMFRGQQYFDSLGMYLYQSRLAHDETNEKKVGNIRTHHYGEYMLAQMACGPNSYETNGKMTWYNTQTNEVRELKESMAQCKKDIDQQMARCDAGQFIEAGRAVCDVYWEAYNSGNGVSSELAFFRPNCMLEEFEKAGQKRCEEIQNNHVDDQTFSTIIENLMSSPSKAMQKTAQFIYGGSYPECSDHIVEKASFIRAVTGLSFGFDPPRITENIDPKICQQVYQRADENIAKEYVSQNTLFPSLENMHLVNPYNGGWLTASGSAYSNLIDLVADNVGEFAFDKNASRS
ncbi:MAG: hypothetical protein R2827_15990, partial [Bdellovibrionales bacterium]